MICSYCSMNWTCESKHHNTITNKIHNEESYSSSFSGYSLGPNMAVPTLTVVLPISICKIRVRWLENIVMKISYNNTCPLRLIHVLERKLLTACSKSAVMPIDSSHFSSGIPSALQTSVLQLDNVWRIQNKIQFEELTISLCNKFPEKLINRV